MLIPTKCPVSKETVKVTPVSVPSTVLKQHETDPGLRLDETITPKTATFVSSLSNSCFHITFRSSSVDVPSVETLVSSATLHEDDVKVPEVIPDMTEEKREKSPSPAITLPPHTSPELSFASEVCTDSNYC